MARISLVVGEGSIAHNRRDYAECKEGAVRKAPENIDPARTHENVELADESLEEAYEKLFGDAVEAYNTKQKRADRKIEDYLNKIKHSKNGEKTHQEMIVQWGSKEDFEDPEKRERAKEALIDYVNDFQKRNPHLYVFSAHIHMDENSPHLHLDYIPWGDGYKTGMAVRNSLHQALKQQGFEADKSKGKESRYNNLSQAFEKAERERFVEICKEHGLETEPPVPKAERGTRQNMTVPEYKAFKANVEKEASREAQKLLQPAKEELAETNKQIKKNKGLLKQQANISKQKDESIAKKTEKIKELYGEQRHYWKKRDHNKELADKEARRYQKVHANAISAEERLNETNKELEAAQKELDEIKTQTQAAKEEQHESKALKLFMEQADEVLEPHLYVENPDELTKQCMEKFDNAWIGKAPGRGKGKFLVAFDNQEQFDHAKNLVGHGHILKTLIEAKDKAVEWVGNKVRDKIKELTKRDSKLDEAWDHFRAEKERFKSGEAMKEYDQHCDERERQIRIMGQNQADRSKAREKELDAREEQMKEERRQMELEKANLARMRGMTQEELDEDREEVEKYRKIKLAMAYAKEHFPDYYEKREEDLKWLDEEGQRIKDGVHHLDHSHGMDKDGRDLPEEEEEELDYDDYDLER